MSLHSPNKILARLTVNVKMSSKTATLVLREKYERKKENTWSSRQIQSAVNV